MVSSKTDVTITTAIRFRCHCLHSRCADKFSIGPLQSSYALSCIQCFPRVLLLPHTNQPTPHLVDHNIPPRLVLGILPLKRPTLLPSHEKCSNVHELDLRRQSLLVRPTELQRIRLCDLVDLHNVHHHQPPPTVALPTPPLFGRNTTYMVSSGETAEACFRTSPEAAGNFWWRRQ